MDAGSIAGDETSQEDFERRRAQLREQEKEKKKKGTKKRFGVKKHEGGAGVAIDLGANEFPEA
jgi:hypothetical protein